MEALHKIVAMASLCLLTTSTGAQVLQTTERTNNLKHVDALQEKWFTLPPASPRYEIIVALDKGESVIIRFNRFNDWAGGDDFRNALAAVDKVIPAYKDSLRDELSTLVLDIHIPASQKNLITRFDKYNESGKMMTINDDGASSLKLGMDTLRVLQAKADTSSRIQYTILLKQLNNYTTYARDEAWKMKTIRVIDSAVSLYRAKWRKPNAERHGFAIDINPAKNTQKVNGTSRLTHSLLVGDASIGASLVRNSICPSVEIGIGIHFGVDRNSSLFVRLSDYTFVRFKEISNDKFKGFSTGFVNLELGVASNQVTTNSPFYKTSLGFGYKLTNKKAEDRDPSMARQMYRMFFNYSLNKFITITPEFFGSFKKADRDNNWFGMSVKFNVF